MFTAQIWETHEYKPLRQREMELNNKGQQLEIIIEGKTKAGAHRKVLTSHQKSLLQCIPQYQEKTLNIFMTLRSLTFCSLLK